MSDDGSVLLRTLRVCPEDCVIDALFRRPVQWTNMCNDVHNLLFQLMIY